MKVTVFDSIEQTTNGKYVNVYSVLEAIRIGRLKNKVNTLRSTKDTLHRRNLKNSLPSICFSGLFKERNDNGIIEHSGLVVLDFDHVENLEGFKKAVCQDEFTFAAFISPSGDGLKVLVKIPANVTDHASHYMALIKKYPTLDPTSRNLSRVCFASWDENIYINPNSSVFTEKQNVVTSKREILVDKYQFTGTDYKKVAIAVDMIRNSVDGEKHHQLIRASRLMGGFVAGGYVGEEEARRLLQYEINERGVDDFRGACKTIDDGLSYGMRDPIRDNNLREKVKVIIEQDIIIDGEPAKDVVYLNDIRDKLISSFNNGTSRGETTYFPNIDKHWRWKRGELNLFHGFPNGGKSTALYQLALVKAVRDGYKFGVFSPENMPEEEFYKDLIHTYVGKSTEKHHKNQMSIIELENAMKFIGEHFYLIYPKDESPTPEYINKRFRELLIKHNIDGCIIDPYNQLDNDIKKHGGRDDQYLSVFLSQAKRFAVEMNLFYFVIAHPNSNVTLDKGDYNCPTPYTISGGSMWNNKCDNIVAIHRPRYLTCPEDTTVMFKSQKIKKQKLNGVCGEAYLEYNRMTARYYFEDVSPFDRVYSQGTINIDSPLIDLSHGESEPVPF